MRNMQKSKSREKVLFAPYPLFFQSRRKPRILAITLQTQSLWPQAGRTKGIFFAIFLEMGQGKHSELQVEMLFE